MASSELDWTTLQSYELDSTDGTASEEEEEESTDGTASDEEVRLMSADRTDDPASSKTPSSEIVARTIAVEHSAPLAVLPADANAAFSQWLSGSGLAPSQH